ncbi:HNH endonuclease [Streptomyces sp. NPDC088910]|uniref:HNH endonuclease n=1 Tax=Streptomyces sp. NPDC088910 TaxID=3365911 RepID=UPI00382C4A91
MNSARVRARKRSLAARDGAWCAYCGRLFADLRHASIDHVVPISLFRTWAAEHTVLACRPCNDRKADRLPLLLALLLTRPGSADRTHYPSGARHRVDWLLLARLAAACESAGWLPESADCAPDRPRQRSQPDQPERPTRLAIVGADVRTRPHPTVRTAGPGPTTRLGTLREAA